MTQLQAERYRLVTRSDFDGLVCAALLKQLDMLDDIKFVHPKDMQDGKVEIGRRRHHDQPPVRPGRRTSRSTTTTRETRARRGRARRTT